MHHYWHAEAEAYDGTQLRSLFAYLRFGLLGDSIVSWQGACSVSPEHMVDGEDLRQGAIIAGDHMLHWLVEIFGLELTGGVALQRLLASLLIDELRKFSPLPALTDGLRREGDDIYLEHKKLSISIATSSPVSTLIHFAVNVDNRGTPVPTLALADLGVSAEALARSVNARFAAEFESIRAATQKVRWVR